MRPEFTEQTMTPEVRMRREQQGSASPKTILHSGDGLPHHTSGTYSHSSMMDYTRIPISEMHLGKFPDLMQFRSWKVNFKTGVCASVLKNTTDSCEEDRLRI